MTLDLDRFLWSAADIPPADGPWRLDLPPGSDQAVLALRDGWFDGGLGI